MNEIAANADLLARDVTERHAQLQPEIFARYGPIGKFRCREDARFHLERLATAVELSAPALFVDYVAWAKVVLTTRRIPGADLVRNLRILDDVLNERLRDAAPASAIVRAAIDAFPAMPASVPSFIDAATESGRIAQEYLQSLLRGDAAGAANILRDAVARGASLTHVYKHVLEPAQQEIGRLWQLNEITVAQEHFCTSATSSLVNELNAGATGGGSRPRTIVAACAAGEQHELGLRLLTNVLQSAGWRMLYLGANVPSPAVVSMCTDHKADLLLVSATVSVNIPAAAELIQLFRAAPQLARSHVVVGGAAFQTHPALWRAVGADAFARGSDECLALVESLFPA
jgi:MerR family transcriptional regulator, light-induced transcriptional regulator